MARHFQFDDGGRSATGYKGKTGDCVVRSIAIATGFPYQQIYDLVNGAATDIGNPEVLGEGRTKREPLPNYSAKVHCACTTGANKKKGAWTTHKRPSCL